MKILASQLVVAEAENISENLPETYVSNFCLLVPLQTTRALRVEDQGLPVFALISESDKDLLLRLWAVLVPRGVDEVSASRLLSLLQVLALLCLSRCCFASSVFMLVRFCRCSGDRNRRC